MLTLWLAPGAQLEAQVVAAGPEFQVNTFTQGNQYNPDVAAAGNGDFVLVWNSFSQGGIFGQRYASSGSALGSEFRVSTSTLHPQYSPAVGAAANGDFVVVWYSTGGQDGDGYGVFGQRFASSGTALGGEFQVNAYTYYDQGNPAVAVAGNGDFVVVWQSYYQDGSEEGIFGRRYASNGSTLSGEFQVNTYTSNRQNSPNVAAAPNGDFVIVWQGEFQDGSAAGIFGQRFASSGSTVGSEFQVNTFTLGNQLLPTSAAAGDGSFVVTWSSYGNHDGDAGGIFGQRYDSGGAAVGSEFQVNTYTTNIQALSDVAAASNGDFVVTWQSRLQDGDQEGIFAQRYASNGSPVGGEFQVNSYTTSYQSLPAVAAAPNGNFVVAWQSSRDGDLFGVFAQRYAAPAGCSPTPLSGCASPGKSLLQIKDKDEDGAGVGDKLVWKWLKGTAVMQPGFGNPTSSADYHFCVYAGPAALAIDATVPAGPPWEAINTKGYKYKDASAAIDGIKQILLKGGAAGKSKILVKGKDAGLGLTPSTLPFTSTDVLVQLSNSDNSNCFETSFAVSSAKKNTEGQFKAKGP